MSRKTFVRKLKSDLRWQPSRSSSSRRSNLGLKHHWSIWGTTEPTTIQLKHYRTLYAKKESVMRLTRQLLSIKWTGWRPQPGHQRQSSLHFSDANLTPSSGFILHDTYYAVLVYNNLLHSALGKISKRTLSWNWSCWLQSSGRTNQNCSCSKNCEVLAWQVCLYRGKSNSRALPGRRTLTLKFLGTYACKTWGFLRLTSRAQRKTTYCRPP